MLGRYLSRQVGTADIDRTCRFCGDPAHGRPRLAGEGADALQFSLSRTGGVVLVAVTTGAVIGLDVEALDRARDWHVIAEHFFTADERAHLDRIAEPRRAAAFLTAWTVKEACLKADGRGLVAGPDAVEVLVDLGALEPTVVTNPWWHVSTFVPAPDQIAALASERPIGRVLTWDWPGPPAST